MSKVVQFRSSDTLKAQLKSAQQADESVGSTARRELERWYILNDNKLRDVAFTHGDLTQLVDLLKRIPLPVLFSNVDMYLFKDVLLQAANKEPERFSEELRTKIEAFDTAASVAVAGGVERAMTIHRQKGGSGCIDIADLLEAGFPIVFGGEVVAPSSKSVRSAEQGAKTAAERKENSGTVISLTGVSGGVGTTSIALNLAAYLVEERDKSVAVVDLNIKRGDVVKYMGAYAANTVVDIWAIADTLTAEDLKPYLAYSEDGGFYALIGPHDPLFGDPEYLNPQLYKTLLSRLVELFDVVILDTPQAEQGVPLLEEFALPMADKTIFVLDSNWTSIHGARVYLNHAMQDLGGVYWLLSKYQKEAKDSKADDDGIVTLESVKNAMSTIPTICLGAIDEDVAWRKAGNAFGLVKRGDGGISVDVFEAVGDLLD